MNKIGLIACCSKKLIGKYKAKDIYISDLFKESKRYCELYLDDYYILSAKYGLLNKDNVIENYDMTLKNMNKKEILDWSNLIEEKLQLFKSDILYILAGKLYYKYWIKDFNYKLVFENLKGIGYILQYLKQENNKDEERYKFFS